MKIHKISHKNYPIPIRD